MWSAKRPQIANERARLSVPLFVLCGLCWWRCCSCLLLLLVSSSPRCLFDNRTQGGTTTNNGSRSDFKRNNLCTTTTSYDHHSCHRMQQKSWSIHICSLFVKSKMQHQHKKKHKAAPTSGSTTSTTSIINQHPPGILHCAPTDRTHLSCILIYKNK